MVHEEIGHKKLEAEEVCDDSYQELLVSGLSREKGLVRRQGKGWGRRSGSRW